MTDSRTPARESTDPLVPIIIAELTRQAEANCDWTDPHSTPDSLGYDGFINVPALVVAIRGAGDKVGPGRDGKMKVDPGEAGRAAHAALMSQVGPDDFSEAQRIIGGLLDCGFQPGLVARARRWLDRAEAGELIDTLGALERWLEHEALCPAFMEPSHECTCGLAQAVARVEAAQVVDPYDLAFRLGELAGALDAGGITKEELADSVVEIVREMVEGPGGRCRICGCTEDRACEIDVTEDGPYRTCRWTDASQTLCDAPSCVAAAKAEDDRNAALWRGEDEGCPKGDPGCDAPNDGEWHCHDACEAPLQSVAVARVIEPLGGEPFPPADPDSLRINGRPIGDFRREPPMEGLECMKGQRQPVPGVYGPDQVPEAVEDQRLRRYGPGMGDAGQGSREQAFGGGGVPGPAEGPCGHYPAGERLPPDAPEE